MQVFFTDQVRDELNVGSSSFWDFHRPKLKMFTNSLNILLTKRLRKDGSKGYVEENRETRNIVYIACGDDGN